jgi:signal transduction histidine kinase
VLATAGILPYNQVTSTIMPIGSVCEVLLLSFALADKIDILKKQKAESDYQSLQLAIANERFVREQNQSLEQKVHERTVELEDAVSDLNDAYDTLKKAQSQLVINEKMASLGQLTAGIAHEINNPINFVSGSVNPLRRDIDDLLELYQSAEEIALNAGSEEEKKKLNSLKTDLELDYIKNEINTLLDGMEDGAKRTVNIVRGLKTFSRVDETDLNRISIAEGIDSTLVLLNNSMKDSIKMIKRFEPVPMVECYAGQINQVCMNILSNAMQALKDDVGNPDPTIKITLSCSDDQKLVFISIKDNGPGIPKGVRERIFEPFFTTKPVGEGTGLGLSICHGIVVESHNGELDVITKDGEGTEFIITLPVDKT